MIRKKSKFFTFIFSTMFGAGHMYMGFMKQGVSIMSLAALLVAIGYVLRMEVFLLILPVLWFYSFFDSINKMSMPDMMFKQQEDHFIFLDNKDNRIIIDFIKKYDYAVAVGLIALGGILIADNMLDFLTSRFYMGAIGEVIRSLRWDAPKLLFAAFIIFIGVRMIQGKKKELDKEEKTDSVLKAAVVTTDNINPKTESVREVHVDTVPEIIKNIPDVIKEEEENENP
ncbi:hypothetical protein acsn021_32040 [Anaerocolumna cellulosilytica]|uniref:Uncharacterized protein n=1 Tax=Anaerocolumna cellulosilytica TaxID=433286 RepID=A0A6S6R8X5_9FIRM|nr:hypothetical protein [Anaerocolumna cellulosilytica]MBB5196534.1 hypothetical protein [Anaerocolumna cellulosilytica]BCJ95635.1 hypothetical protein acsn021_32040 [Anaerocolumna cellulosilytica]